MKAGNRWTPVRKKIMACDAKDSGLSSHAKSLRGDPPANLRRERQVSCAAGTGGGKAAWRRRKFKRNSRAGTAPFPLMGYVILPSFGILHRPHKPHRSYTHPVQLFLSLPKKRVPWPSSHAIGFHATSQNKNRDRRNTRVAAPECVLCRLHNRAPAFSAIARTLATSSFCRTLCASVIPENPLSKLEARSQCPPPADPADKERDESHRS